MNDGEALLRAILEHPDEDTPRLMYADYLDEHGDPERASLIRVQVELARGMPHERRFDALRAEARELLAAEANGLTLDWLGPVPRRRGFDHVFTRGFVATIRCTCEEFTLHAAAIFKAHPVVEVDLTDKSPVDGVGWSRQPHALRPRHGRYAARRLTVADRVRASLPGCIFSRLPGVLGVTNWVDLGDTSVALRAVSDACVSYGREIAGLPPLPTEGVA